MNGNLPPGVTDADIDPHHAGIATVEIVIRVCVSADCDDAAIEEAEQSIELPPNSSISKTEVLDWDFS